MTTFVQSYISEAGIHYNVSRGEKGYCALLLPPTYSGKRSTFVGYFKTLAEIKNFCQNVTVDNLEQA